MGKGASDLKEALLTPDADADAGGEGEELETPLGEDVDGGAAGEGEDIEEIAGEGEGEGEEAGEGEGEGEDDGEYKPPNREDFEAMQQHMAMLEELVGPELEKMLAADGEGEGAGSQDVDAAALAEMLKPKTFELADDAIHDILVKGDPGALRNAFKAHAEVMEHNHRIDMNKAVLNGIKYAMPIVSATGKFYDRNPELSGMRELVERHMWDIRGKLPEANEMQILRLTEKRLKPIIDKAKKIAAQKAAGKGAPTNLSTTPGATARGTTPRAAAGAGGGQKKPITSSRIDELMEFASESRV